MTETGGRLARTSKAQQIVDTAYRLFKENGFYATGVDLIMREANVSKRTMYHYFATKNDLVVAVLEHYQAQYRQHMDTLLDREHRSARENLLAIFEDAKTWFADVHFHGCLAVNAMGEYGGKDPAIEQACLRFKQWEIGLLQELAAELDARHGETLAYQLFVLLEGMVSAAHMLKEKFPIDMTAMAEAIIDRRGQ